MVNVSFHFTAEKKNNVNMQTIHSHNQRRITLAVDLSITTKFPCEALCSLICLCFHKRELLVCY